MEAVLAQPAPWRWGSSEYWRRNLGKQSKISAKSPMTHKILSLQLRLALGFLVFFKHLFFLATVLIAHRCMIIGCEWTFGRTEARHQKLWWIRRGPFCRGRGLPRSLRGPRLNRLRNPSGYQGEVSRHCERSIYQLAASWMNEDDSDTPLLYTLV